MRRVKKDMKNIICWPETERRKSARVSLRFLLTLPLGTLARTHQ